MQLSLKPILNSTKTVPVIRSQRITGIRRVSPLSAQRPSSGQAQGSLRESLIPCFSAGI